MSRMKDYLEIGEINQILDELLSNINVEMDLAVVEDLLDDVKIRRLVTERITVKRIKNILTQALNQEE